MELIYVDDDAANRAVMREMLATAGLVMAEAADAVSGLEAIDSGDFDVVLMDLRMPQMNGLTAIRQLRARTGAKGRTPVLVVTADLTAGVKELCKGAGADAFLAKPVDMEQLFTVIGSLLAKRPDRMIA
jgi:CheY-like chemotaxis protein